MVQHGTLAFFNFNFYPSLIQCVALSLGPGQEVNEADEDKSEVKILVCFPVSTSQDYDVHYWSYGNIWRMWSPLWIKCTVTCSDVSATLVVRGGWTF